MARGTIRPGGRTEKVRKAVASAVLAFLKEGSTEFSVMDVVQKSGIARSTLYARWPTREALIAEALTAHNSEFRFAQSGDWRRDLHEMARAFRDFAMDPAEIAINSAIAYMGPGFLHEETWRQWQSISRRMAEPLRQAQAAGEIRPDIDPTLVISSIFTVITGLIVIAKQRPEDAYLKQLVDIQISGCTAVQRENSSPN